MLDSGKSGRGVFPLLVEHDVVYPEDCALIAVRPCWWLEDSYFIG